MNHQLPKGGGTRPKQAGKSRIAIVCALALGCSVAAFAATYPAWWTTRQVVSTAANTVTNDYAPATLGQLKWMAEQAAVELTNNAPAVLLTNITILVNGFGNSNNFAPATVGQGKAVAKSFHDFLISIGYTTNYPWTGVASNVNDWAPLLNGQLKTLFNFDVAADVDGDGYSDITECLNGSDRFNSNSIPAKTLAGTITYTGVYTGTIWIIVTDYPSNAIAPRLATLASPGSYTVTNLPPNRNYAVTAYRDSNGNQTQNVCEAAGSFGGNPLWLTNNVSGVNITLTADELAPLLTIPTNRQLTCGDSTNPANTGYAFAVDAIDPFPVVTYSDSMTGFCPHIIFRQWTAVDACGNQTSAVQQIDLQPAGAPALFNIPPDAVVSCPTIPEMPLVWARGFCRMPVTDVPSDDLVLYCSFDSNSTPAVADGSGSGHTGTVRGAVWQSQGWQGAGFRIGASNSGIAFGDILPINDYDTELTMSAWVRVPTNAVGENIPLFAQKQRDAWPFTGWSVGLQGGFVNVVQTRSYPVQAVLASTNSIADGTWHHLAVAMKAYGGEGWGSDFFATQTIYLDGRQAASSFIWYAFVWEEWPEISTDFWIGSETNDGLSSARVEMDEVRAYRRYLNGDEIGQLAWGGIPVTTNEFWSMATCTSVLTRVWTAMDTCGNTISATQRISVINDSPPQLQNVPGDITLVCGDTIPDPPDVTALGCMMNTVAVDFVESSTGSCPRTITRTWTAMDACGNFTQAVQTITISTNTVADSSDDDMDEAPNYYEIEMNSDPFDPNSYPVTLDAQVVYNSGQSGVTKLAVMGQLRPMVRYSFNNDSGSIVTNDEEYWAYSPPPDDYTASVVGGTYTGSGYTGGGFQFTGAVGRLEMSDVFDVNFAHPDLSVCAWFKTTNTSGSKGIIAKRDGTLPVSPGWEMGVTTGGIAYAEFMTSESNLLRQVSAGAFADGSWHHMCAVWSKIATNEMEGSLFIDGSLVQRGVLTNQVLEEETDAGVVVGAGDNAGNRAFSGTLDEVHIYDRPLSLLDVSNVWASGETIITTQHTDMALSNGSQYVALTNLVTRYTYWATAYVDSNTNDTQDSTEAWGQGSLPSFKFRLINHYIPYYGGFILYYMVISDPDSDLNGLADYWEMLHFGHLAVDPDDDEDGDGLTNGDEFSLGTDPNSDDSDADGMTDLWENIHGLHPLSAADASLDPDGDGLNNLGEFLAGADPADPDTDADQLPDGLDANPVLFDDELPQFSIVSPANNAVIP